MAGEDATHTDNLYLDQSERERFDSLRELAERTLDDAITNEDGEARFTLNGHDLLAKLHMSDVTGNGDAYRVNVEIVDPKAQGLPEESWKRILFEKHDSAVAARITDLSLQRGSSFYFKGPHYLTNTTVATRESYGSLGLSSFLLLMDERLMHWTKSKIEGDNNSVPIVSVIHAALDHRRGDAEANQRWGKFVSRVSNYLGYQPLGEEVIKQY